MTQPSLPRALLLADRLTPLRPKAMLAAAGVVVAMAAGCAWLGAASARTAARVDAMRIEAATAAGFTDEALAAAAGGLDPSALAIARRHDPYTVAGGAQRDRQAEFLTARLEQLKARGATPPAAGPFKLSGALDASRDLECLTQAAYYEARGEGREGMRAVAQVVLNRVRSPAFPKTVCGVVFQGAARRSGCQFSFTCDGSMRGGVNRAAWDRAREVASAALSGRVYAAVGTATHFHTTGVAPGWRNALIRVNQVGDHVFYRFGGRSRSQGSFTYAADRSTPSRAADAPSLIQAKAESEQATPLSTNASTPSATATSSTAKPYDAIVAEEAAAT